MKTREILLEIIICLFVMLFLYAAGSKLVEFNKFMAQMGKSPLITDFSSVLVWVVPASEILICILLILPKTKKIGLYASFGIMTVFTFYIIAILNYSAELPCSCGGVLSMLGWREHLIFNIAFSGLAVIGIALYDMGEKFEVKPVII